MLIFISGTSGSGKSTISSALSQAFNLLFLEIDLWRVDGIRYHRLSKEWKRFEKKLDPVPLAQELQRRAFDSAKRGTGF